MNRIGSNRPGQSLVQAPLHQEWRRSENDDVERAAAGSVCVPEPLDRLRPAIDFLDLVQNEHESSRRVPRLIPAALPGILQPPAVASVRDASRIPGARFGRAGRRTSPRVIHRLVPTTSLGDRQCLVSRRRLARLPGAENGDEALRSLRQPLHDRRHLRAPVGVAHSGSVASRITTLSKLPQDRSRKCSRESSEGPRRSLHGDSRRRQRPRIRRLASGLRELHVRTYRRVG